MNKALRLIITLFIGGVGGVVFCTISLPSMIKANVFGFGDIFTNLIAQETPTIIKTEEKITIIDPDYWIDIVKNSKSSSVLVQSFNGGVLLSQGSGIVLTSDGIIAVPLSVVSSQAKTYQIFCQDGVYEASVLSRSLNQNLAFLKIKASNLQVLGFSNNSGLELGQSGIIVGKKMQVSELKDFSQSAIVREIYTSAFYLDTAFSRDIVGGALISSRGELLGMVQINNKNQTFVIPAKTLKDLLEKQLKA